jgi:hypothetical protein
LSSTIRTWTDTRAKVGLHGEGRWLTTWAMAQPNVTVPSSFLSWVLHSNTLINSFISDSIFLVRTLAASHGMFCNLFRYSVGLLWTSDKPIAKASTYTGEHNTERWDEDKHPCLNWNLNPWSQCTSEQGLLLRLCSHWDQHHSNRCDSNFRSFYQTVIKVCQNVP